MLPSREDAAEAADSVEQLRGFLDERRLRLLPWEILSVDFAAVPARLRWYITTPPVVVPAFIDGIRSLPDSEP